MRSGTHTVDPSEVGGEDAIERRTTNSDLVTALGDGLDADRSVSLRVPVGFGGLNLPTGSAH